MNPFDIGDTASVVISIIAWTVLGFASGAVVHRLDDRHLSADTSMTRLRDFEQGGGWYRRWLAIHRWKDRLPEAGNFFAGGFDKSSLGGRDAGSLQRFVVETRRAELVHWFNLASVSLFALWCRPDVWTGMATFAVVANIPFIAVQRHNRARLTVLVDKLQQRNRTTRTEPAARELGRDRTHDRDQNRTSQPRQEDAQVSPSPTPNP